MRAREIDLMGRVILHVGMHKTASKSLQSFGYGNRAELRRRGLCVATSGMNRRFCNLLTKRTVDALDLARIRRYWDRVFEPMLRRHPGCALLISHERIHGIFWRTAASERLAALRACLEGHQVRVLLYVRRQDEWCESMHNQLVKRGVLTESFEDYVQRIMHSSAIDLDCLYRYWVDGFGANAVDLRLFEPGEARQGAILADYAGAIGVGSLAGLRIPAEKNQRLVTPLLEIKRRFNARPWLRFGQLVVKEVLFLLQTIRSGNPERTLSPELSARIMARYGPGNAWLAAQRADRPDPPPLFASPRPLASPPALPLSRRSVSQLLREWWSGA